MTGARMVLTAKIDLRGLVTIVDGQQRMGCGRDG